MAAMLIQKVDEVPKKTFLPKCTAKSGLQESVLKYGSI
jgi:hypothetical protein